MKSGRRGDVLGKAFGRRHLTETSSLSRAGTARQRPPDASGSVGCGDTWSYVAIPPHSGAHSTKDSQSSESVLHAALQCRQRRPRPDRWGALIRCWCAKACLKSAAFPYKYPTRPSFARWGWAAYSRSCVSTTAGRSAVTFRGPPRSPVQQLRETVPLSALLLGPNSGSSTTASGGRDHLRH